MEVIGINDAGQTITPAQGSVTNDMISGSAAIAQSKVNLSITDSEIASSLDLSAKTVTLPVASVTAHVTAYDDAGLRNDISTLALHSAIADNKAAFNLSNSFVDQFEDDTGIDVLTGCSRKAEGEYVYAATETTEAYHMNSAGVATLYGGTTPTFSGTNDSRTTISGAAAMNSFSLAQPSVTLPNDGLFTFEHTLVQPADPSTQVRFAVFKNVHTLASWSQNGGTSAGANYAFLSADSAGKKVKNVYDTEEPNVITSYEDTGSGYG
ncbi:MAG: hypothetical protein GY922_11400, partial [Proteobacteria bacterium]|nr:hypothetical protein [Pseudomonadota bacterium]